MRRFLATGSGLAALSLALLAAYDGHGATAAGATPRQLRIALNVALSGPGAPFGRAPMCAWQVVSDGYNRAGGLDVGGKRYQIKLIVDDNKWDPTVTRSAIEKEVFQDKVKIVKTIGDPGDAIIVPVTEPANVLLLDSTANTQYLKKPYKYVVGTWPQPSLTAPAFFKALLQREPQVKKAYHIAYDLQFDRNNTAWAKAALTRLGVAWKGQIFYRAGTVDFTSVVAPSVRAHPDLIVLGSVGGDAPAIVRTLRQLGYRGVIASDVMAQSLENIVKGTGADTANGVYQAEVGTYPPTAALISYRRAYEARCSGDWDPAEAVLFWTEAKFSLEAIRKAGVIDQPAKILEAMSRTTIRSPFVRGTPTVTLGGEAAYGRPRLVLTPQAINQFKDGEYRTVAVLDYAK